MGWHQLVSISELRNLTARAVDCRAITSSQVPDVVQEWREPSHREFRPRNLWSPLNAFTEVYKTGNLATTVSRSEALHGLYDGAVGLVNRLIEPEVERDNGTGKVVRESGLGGLLNHYMRAA